MRLRLEIRLRDGLNRDRHQFLNLQFSNKPVSPPRHSLHEPRTLRRISQRLPNLVDGRIEVVINIHKGVRPEALLQFLPRDQVARALQQDGEHLERLSAEPQLHAILAHLARLYVCFKCAEAYKPGTRLRISHWGSPFSVNDRSCCPRPNRRATYSTSRIPSSYADPYLFHMSLTWILPPIH